MKLNMRKAKQFLAVALVATALYADRIATAEPALRANRVTEFARQFATRLTVGFRRTVSIVRLHQARQEGVAEQQVALTWTRLLAVVHPVQYESFQFRLPPPIA